MSQESPLMPQHHSSQGPSVERFWGSLVTPMDVILACDEVDGVVVDLASLSPAARTRVDKLGEERGEVERSLHNDHWRGPQRAVSRLFQQALGTYRPATELPKQHSSWRGSSSLISSASLLNSGLRQEVSQYSLQGYPLFEGLLSGIQERYERPLPLTIVTPSALYNASNTPLFSDESLAAYQLAGWSPNLIFYDWVLDHLGQRFSNDVDQRKRKTEDIGDMSRALIGIVTHLCHLKVYNNLYFQRLLENKLSLGHLDQGLSLVSIDDLISTVMLIHQLPLSGERYLLRGDQLTWKSLTQLCAHLIDELPTSALNVVSRQLSVGLTEPREGAGNHYPSWLHAIIKALRSYSSQPHSPVSSLRSEITNLISLSHGGANINRDQSYFSPLPQQVEWSPILSVLEREVSQLVMRLR